MKTFDALVIGAGPAGATAALLLARAGWSVAVVEKAAFPRRKVCGEYVSATTWPVLRDLGIDATLVVHAGPPVRRVGLFAGERVVEAPMPAFPGGTDPWGRALEREFLDNALLERARHCGARVWQPWSAVRIAGSVQNFRVEGASPDGSLCEISARAIIAAQGSWERSVLPAPKPCARPSDLLGFKAHFTESRLTPGFMPLVLFPGGYGGMVHTGRGRVSFSSCIRRDALAACRRERRGMAAGEAVLAHVMEACRGVRTSLAGAARAGPWLSAGPIRPGMRARAADGIFVVGNAAGEAHPLVAEGISMAIQSAWLLCEPLIRAGPAAPRLALARIGRDYSKAWQRQFARRVHAAALFAALTTSPRTAAASVALMKHVPAILTWGARWSGKAHTLRPEST
jgi:2-polyprenyl-6-methoxyphenol hydroxylase-like FAD-dependent oxidoreductase